MKAGTITAKLRDAVPVCFFENDAEQVRYKNIDIPDSLKELEITGFEFDVPADGKISFRLYFAPGILGDDAIHASRLPEGNGKGKKGGSKSKNRSIKYVCPECGTSIRATREVNVICGDCEVPFERE